MLVIKVLFSIFFIFKSDLVVISREMADVGIYSQVIENDSIVLKKQKLFQIVRNEEDRGIIIKIRKKNHVLPLEDKEGVHDNPIVD